MSGIVTAIVGTAVVGGVMQSKAAGKAAKASEEAAATQAGAQREQLAYLKEREALPQYYREQALTQLGGLYGLGAPATAAPSGFGPGEYKSDVARLGFAGAAPRPRIEDYSGGMKERMFSFAKDMKEWERSQGATPLEGEYIPAGEAPAGAPALGKAGFVESLRQDPFYEQLVASGEEAVLRGASATGGLRSGTASENLARLNQDVLRGIYGERVAGLKGLAGMPSGAGEIGRVMGDIGTTQAGGILGAGQAQQAKYQGYGDIVGGLGSKESLGMMGLL